MLVAIDQGVATLVAAVIAAAAGVITLVIQSLSSRRAEMRAAHRDALAPYLDDLGKSIHENLSFSVLTIKRTEAGNSVTEVLANGRRAADDLKDLRRKVRYTLPGLEEPLRTLARLPDWVALQRGHDGDGAKQLVEAGKELQQGVDAAIRRSYRAGLPPGRLRCWVLQRRAGAVRALHDSRTKRPVGGPSDELDEADPVP